MTPDIPQLLAPGGGAITYRQLREHVGRRVLERLIREGKLVRIWPGIYSAADPDALTRLRGLDLRCGESVAVCLHTAAAVHGFDTEAPHPLHVLNPAGHQLRSDANLRVHRRDGVALVTVRGRLVTPPAWTAVEVAARVARPRALATLDAALHSRTCTVPELLRIAEEHSGRRGLAQVRELVPLARPEAESPMESEARLVMHDGGLPDPELQQWLIDLEGKAWRVDFLWRAARLIVEYDGFDWHKSPEDQRHDHQKRVALEEAGYRLMAIVCDDVRREGERTARRIGGLLERRAA